MLRRITILLLIIFAAVLQSSFLPAVFSGRIVPDIALILTVIWVVSRGFEDSLARIVVLSFFSDILSFRPVGLSVIPLVLIAFGVSSFSKRFMMSQRTWKLSVAMLLVFFATIFNGVLVFFLSRLIGYATSGTPDYLTPVLGISIFATAALNVITLAAVYFPIKKLEKFLEMYEFKKVILK
ncbi:MAG: rod shape-determining protein MreD [Candidatus Moranbacteria bacterium]|nr:rod shape-determining protein MreD [Candidatus Moranbacteria bacterium]